MMVKVLVIEFFEMCNSVISEFFFEYCVFFHSTTFLRKKGSRSPKEPQLEFFELLLYLFNTGENGIKDLGFSEDRMLVGLEKSILVLAMGKPPCFDCHNMESLDGFLRVLVMFYFVIFIKVEF